ncbi:MAG: AraC family transcriptional regulator [Lachnospiraceae bacterium]|nr:AraC family transcriptional regulator [Lachnospiraceae bacterium]
MQKKIIQDESIYDYLKGLKKFPENYGNLRISGLGSKSDIWFYNWDLTFVTGLEAERPNNLGQDEIQIIFNLNKEISWDVIRDANHGGKVHVKMKVGDVCVYRNNDAKTTMYYAAGESFKFKSIQMKVERFEQIVGDLFDKKDAIKLKEILYKNVGLTAITPDMHRILSEIDSSDKYREFKSAFLETKMVELTALVLFGVARDKKKSPEDIGCFADRKDSEAIKSLREKIQIKPYEDYDAVNVSEELSMSVSKLNRVFRALYGTSLHDYVINQRLEYAASLLEGGEESVSEVAYKSGYNNLSHFAKAFCNKYGITPKAFSKKFRS